MLAPQMRPDTSKRSSTNLPKREELSLRDVLALPKASSSGLDSNTWKVVTPGHTSCQAVFEQCVGDPAMGELTCFAK